MAVYKVPQDVEAEDKLIGPFSFRQFIYLIVAALGIIMAWLLSKIFLGLLVLPLPIVIAFLALALPLRKDQPMETYLIAMIKFFFKPRRRLWDPEGTLSMVQITAPRVTEGPQIKGMSGMEASQRLTYLAQVVDTQGWATRGATSASDNMSDIFVAEASQAEDVLDESSGVAQLFNQKISQSDDARMQAARDQMQATMTAPIQSVPAPVAEDEEQEDALPPQLPIPPEPAVEPDLHINPYPSSMHQSVLRPVGDTPPPPVVTPPEPVQNKPSPETVSPDIMRLANNNDLSISALANEAHRLHDGDSEEVVISLR